MKTFITLAFAAVIATSCNGQNGKAVKDQQDAYKVLDDMKKSGLNPTSEDGWTMTALIDGKPWKATGIYTLSLSSRINGKFQNSYISMDEPRLEVGTKVDFSQSAVDFNPIVDDNCMWGGHSGEMEITKVANGWVEGKFHFTATCRATGKKIEVTNGFFRVKPH